MTSGAGGDSISDTGIPLARFLDAASRKGPAVGLWVGSRPPSAPSSYEYREVTGRTMTTVNGLYETYARAWDFPDYFGHNADAFDECMRELDDSAGPTDSPAGDLTDIVDADRLLAHADRAMYSAKANGGAGVATFVAPTY